MSLISAKWYEDAKVHNIQVKNDLWVSMKDVRNGLGVKNISDVVLKEIRGIYGKEKLTKKDTGEKKLTKEDTGEKKLTKEEQTKCFKMTEREIFEKFSKLSNNELDKLCKKSVFVKNTIMTNIIKDCRGEKKRYKGNRWI